MHQTEKLLKEIDAKAARLLFKYYGTCIINCVCVHAIKA